MFPFRTEPKPTKSSARVSWIASSRSKWKLVAPFDELKSEVQIAARRSGRTTSPRSVLPSSPPSYAVRSAPLTLATPPQDRITDHRIPLTISGLADAMEGGETLDIISRELEIKEEEENLEAVLRGEI
jgi:hypothetical protein